MRIILNFNKWVKAILWLNLDCLKLFLWDYFINNILDLSKYEFININKDSAAKEPISFLSKIEYLWLLILVHTPRLNLRFLFGE